MQTLTEENYLKAIFKISEKSNELLVSTNAIAEELQTKAASVTDMIKRLAQKKLVEYEKYQGVVLNKKGKEIALQIVRKHRLWESFLVEKLHFSWDQVHDVAEELEHIKSNVLTEKLDEFLEYPKYDPHGDPIPDRDGQMNARSGKLLSNLDIGEKGKIVGVEEHTPAFKSLLEDISLSIGANIEVIKKSTYDNSFIIKCANKEVSVSEQVCNNLYIY